MTLIRIFQKKDKVNLVIFKKNWIDELPQLLNVLENNMSLIDRDHY